MLVYLLIAGAKRDVGDDVWLDTIVVLPGTWEDEGCILLVGLIKMRCIHDPVLFNLRQDTLPGLVLGLFEIVCFRRVGFGRSDSCS